ncbi:MAG: ATPase, partial [Deinococcus sp.]|nr:ATPase [Deinococcus sp.]
MRYPLYLPGESRGGSAVRLPDVPLLVLVGLTGVGKSSLLEALAFPTLPDRRELVDRYVLPLFGAVPPLDRKARFEITRRFRETHPGGVAEILAKALVEPVWP